MLTTVYQESERQRQRKLRVARKEREKIIAEEERSGTAKERKSEEEKQSHVGHGRVKNIHGVIPTAALTDKVPLHVLLAISQYYKYHTCISRFSDNYD
jgi:hypothetical protein